MAKTPSIPTPAAAPVMAPMPTVMAPKLNDATRVDTVNGIRKKRGTKALRIDLAAPQGKSGLNIQ